MVSDAEVVVVGGGFFGMYLAAHFGGQGRDVLLIERERDFMQRASYVNQARVHNGYHYPRSILTALRSRISFPRFCAEFADCIDGSFDKYYMIGKLLGNVTAKQFTEFCQRIGAPCEPAPKEVLDWVNPRLIEAAWRVEEVAFDAIKLKQTMCGMLDDNSVSCLLGTTAESIRRDGNQIEILCSATEDSCRQQRIRTRQVFNCTYAMTNSLLTNSGLELIPLVHEHTELCLVEVPEQFRNCGITVMCGPFFSCMPFPPKSMHSFSHVRYTPHYQWEDDGIRGYADVDRHGLSARNSAWRHMQLDAQRYIPMLADCHYKESLFEIKTTLPSSAVDDSRPFLWKPNHGLPGFHCLLGGKIDNIYDAVDVIKQYGLDTG
ncbi:MAG: FAD-binding oxidoreductase [Candidatus Latescibacteria bacterium]|nr:FAD-binding oxidoreductase [Candidatus Latescibacterota bacterium]